MSKVDALIEAWKGQLHLRPTKMAWTERRFRLAASVPHFLANKSR